MRVDLSFGGALRQALILVLVGGASGGAWNLAVAGIPWVRPEPPPPPPDDPRLLPLEAARLAFETGKAVFLDARSPEAFQAGHIRGAWNVPVERFDDRYGRLAAFLPRDGFVIAYCSGAECGAGKGLANRLLERGHLNVKIFSGGWPAWSAAGLPADTGPDPLFGQ